ncbi:MAG: hypothetical protein ACTSXA_14550 [Candidatus Heimdallarchaeota archaeon]
MKRNTRNEKSTELITLGVMSNKDLRKRYLQTRKAIDEHHLKPDFEKSDEIPKDLERLLRMEELYTNELKKRELLDWALSSVH